MEREEKESITKGPWEKKFPLGGGRKPKVKSTPEPARQYSLDSSLEKYTTPQKSIIGKHPAV